MQPWMRSSENVADSTVTLSTDPSSAMWYWTTILPATGARPSANFRVQYWNADMWLRTSSSTWVCDSSTSSGGMRSSPFPTPSRSVRGLGTINSAFASLSQQASTSRTVQLSLPSGDWDGVDVIGKLAPYAILQWTP